MKTLFLSLLLASLAAQAAPQSAQAPAGTSMG
jgi:hypothetical protein